MHITRYFLFQDLYTLVHQMSSPAVIPIVLRKNSYVMVNLIAIMVRMKGTAVSYLLSIVL